MSTRLESAGVDSAERIEAVRALVGNARRTGRRGLPGTLTRLAYRLFEDDEDLLKPVAIRMGVAVSTVEDLVIAVELQERLGEALDLVVESKLKGGRRGFEKSLILLGVAV